MNNFKRTQQYALCIIARNRNRKLEVWGKRKRINNIHWQQPAIHLLHFFNSIIIQSLLGSALFRHSTASLCDISSFVENFSLPEEQHPCVVFQLNWCLPKVSPFPGTVATAFRMLVDPFFHFPHCQIFGGTKGYDDDRPMYLHEERWRRATTNRNVLLHIQMLFNSLILDSLLWGLPIILVIGEWTLNWAAGSQ